MIINLKQQTFSPSGARLTGDKLLTIKTKHMESLYDKQCKGKYLEKYAKNGNLLRTAEQYENGSWIISEYPSSRTNMQGKYTNEEFNNIRRRLF